LLPANKRCFFHQFAEKTTPAAAKALWLVPRTSIQLKNSTNFPNLAKTTHTSDRKPHNEGGSAKLVKKAQLADNESLAREMLVEAEVNPKYSESVCKQLHNDKHKSAFSTQKRSVSNETKTIQPQLRSG
jgi:hypothetical protein